MNPFTQEVKCECCGNHTSVGLTKLGELVCATCAATQGDTMMTTFKTVLQAPLTESKRPSPDPFHPVAGPINHEAPPPATASIPPITPAPPAPSRDKIYNLAIPNMASESQHRIARECLELTRWLLAEHERHANNLISPIRVLSKLGPAERIDVMIDEKLAGLEAHPTDEKNERALIGYLILRRITRKDK